MNYIQKLLNGEKVEWKTLGEVLDYQQPTPFLVQSKEYSDNYKTPVLTAGQSFILGYTNEENGIYKANKEKPVIIFDDFTTSFHWVDFPFKVKSSAMKMLTPINNEEVCFKFVFYAMQCIKYKPEDHARQWISKYSKIQIPIPPLAVQQKIAEILDRFAELEAELEAELHLREKQYAYYRNYLLTPNEQGFLNGKKVEWKSLGEVFNLRNGYTPSKANKEYWEKGEIPWFRMKDIRMNGRILNDALQKVSKSAVKGGKLFPANSIMLATTATIGEHALVEVDYLSNQQLTNFSLKGEYKNKLNIKYAFYYFFLINEEIKKIGSDSTLPIISIKKLEKIKIPIPPMEEQERIVKILDTFDALVNSISEGLPKEIALRRKQYEYYREQLLSFPEN
uniref:restriction endonuclease subunit S n=1 Tax=Ornithobacterium rhinotracheale TaxID=28251 RepID=UPI0039A6345E